jgi:hypothetical protein
MIVTVRILSGRTVMFGSLVDTSRRSPWSILRTAFMSFLPLTMTSTIGAKHAGMASNHPEFVTHIGRRRSARLETRRDRCRDVKAVFYERACCACSIGGWRFLHNKRSSPLQELTRMFENVSLFELLLE